MFRCPNSLVAQQDGSVRSAPTLASPPLNGGRPTTSSYRMAPMLHRSAFASYLWYCRDGTHSIHSRPQESSTTAHRSQLMRTQVCSRRLALKLQMRWATSSGARHGGPASCSGCQCNASCRPDLKDLGRHVEGRPAQRLSQALRLQRTGEAEVADLQHRARAGAAEEQVLRLQVPLRTRPLRRVRGPPGYASTEGLQSVARCKAGAIESFDILVGSHWSADMRQQ